MSQRLSIIVASVLFCLGIGLGWYLHPTAPASITTETRKVEATARTVEKVVTTETRKDGTQVTKVEERQVDTHTKDKSAETKVAADVKSKYTLGISAVKNKMTSAYPDAYYVDAGMRAMGPFWITAGALIQQSPGVSLGLRLEW